MQRWRKLTGLSIAEIGTALHALLVMIVVEALIRPLSLEQLSRLLGVDFDLTQPDPGARDRPPPELPERANRQLWCTAQLARRWPFADGPCLRQSLVAGHLLRRHDPSLRLGVGTGTGDLIAHAWLEIDGAPLEDLDDLQHFHHRPPT